MAIVCTVGLPSTTVDTLQRGGRAYRNSDKVALVVNFYDPWVDDISLDEYQSGDLMDPDRPRTVLKSTSKRRDRASYSSVKLVKCKELCLCVRKFYADYLGDRSTEGMSFLSSFSMLTSLNITALAFFGEFCCDSPVDSLGHPTATHLFDLGKFLPGPVFTEEKAEELRKVAAASKPKAKRKGYRPKADRSALDFRLIKWLKDFHAMDPLRTVRPPYYILPRGYRVKLLIPHPNQFVAPNDVTRIVGESEVWHSEWAQIIFDIIQKYDTELVAHKRRK